MAPTRKRSFVPRPHEASLAEDKGSARPDRFRSRYPVAPCANQRTSPIGRPELVGVPIKEASMKQIDDLVLEELQGQTTFIQAEPAAPTPPAGCRGEDERRRHAGLPALKEHTADARWSQRTQTRPRRHLPSVRPMRTAATTRRPRLGPGRARCRRRTPWQQLLRSRLRGPTTSAAISQRRRTSSSTPQATSRARSSPCISAQMLRNRVPPQTSAFGETGAATAAGGGGQGNRAGGGLG